MSPITHFLGSWLIAAATTNNARDRKLVTLAGILPDADGLGILVDVTEGIISSKEATYHYYQQYHHYLLHGWPGAIFLAVTLACFARERWKVMLLCLFAVHLHFVCDLIGSRGPSSFDLWPIAYGEPIFRNPVFFWKHQWRLDGWQNRTLTVALFLTELFITPRRGFSCVEIFNSRADAVVVNVFRKWRALLLRSSGPR